LEYEVAKSNFPERNKLALIQFPAPFEILPISETVASIYGRIRSDLEKKRQIIGPYDLLIGAQALSEKLNVLSLKQAEIS
jgi:tRNA(fMet)-specific endonuclease VapC